MRDAFGGTFMIQILMVFIIIYVGFIGIAINYGRAFRVKNLIIDYLEEAQIYDLNQTNGVGQNALSAGIGEILDGTKYKNSTVCTLYAQNYDTANSKCVDGVIIQLHGDAEKNGVKHVYYTVNTYIGYNLGFLNSLLSLTSRNSSTSIAGYFRISGETKVLVTK